MGSQPQGCFITIKTTRYAYVVIDSKLKAEKRI